MSKRAIAKADPAEPLRDARRERYAHLRLIGLAPPQACAEAGIHKKNGEPLAIGNAWKIDHEPLVVARKAFLAGHETAIVRETRGFVRNRLIAAASLDLLRDYAIVAEVELANVLDREGKPVKATRVVGIDWDALKKSEHSYAITSFKFDRETGMMTEFDRIDPDGALSQLRDMYGIKAPRRTELTGKDGAPIEQAQLVRYEISDQPMTVDEWARQHAEPEAAAA